MADRKDWRSSTLAERLEAVSKKLGFWESEDRPGVNRMAKKAEIDPGPMSRYMAKREPEDGKKAKGATPELLDKMATAYKVSYRWLAVGAGQADDADVVTPLDAAIMVVDVADSVVAKARAEAARGVERSAREWLEFLLAEQDRANAIVRIGPRPPEPSPPGTDEPTDVENLSVRTQRTRARAKKKATGTR